MRGFSIAAARSCLLRYNVAQSAPADLESLMRAFAPVVLFDGAVSMTFAQSGRQLFGADATRPFSGAAKAGGFIYVAGTIGADAKNKGDIKAQTRQTLETIDRTLKQAGSSLANAVSTMVYLRNAGDFAAMNEVYATFFPKDP